MRKLGFYAIIDYTPEAKKKMTLTDLNKRIYYFYDKYLISDMTETYTETKVELLKSKNMIIKDLTMEQGINTHLVDEALGTISMRHRRF